MAEFIPLEDLNKTHAFEDVDNLEELEAIYNDSSYDTVTLDKSENPNIKQITDELKVKMTNENINKLKMLIESIPNLNIDKDFLSIKLNDLRKRIVSKNGDLYLREPYNPKAIPVRFGKSEWKVIKITHRKGKELLVTKTLTKNGLKPTDPLYELLTYKDETSFIKDAQGNVIGNREQQTKKQVDKLIDSSETLRKTIAFAHDDMTITSTPIIPKQKSVIEDIPRQLEESKELNNVLTSEDRQLIVKYLDFVAINRTKRIQLLSDIEHNKKEIDKAEKQLLIETDEHKKDVLRKVISDSEANIQASKQMLDQIVAYNERQFEDINMRLKSKFTLREKLGYIFKKYGLTITAITLALGLIIDTIVTSVRGTPNITPSPSGNTNLPNKVKQSLKNFSNWLLEMSKKALDNLPAIIGSIISFLLKTTASIVGFLAEHIILFVIALAFALYEALKIGYNDIKRRQ
jgi:hypothetical protein